MEYLLVAVVLAVIAFLCWRIHDQDATIRELTSKLMARSYADYVVGTRAREDPPADITSRKPLSWYDDPNIPDGEDT